MNRLFRHFRDTIHSAHVPLGVAAAEPLPGSRCRLSFELPSGGCGQRERHLLRTARKLATEATSGEPLARTPHVVPVEWLSWLLTEIDRKEIDMLQHPSLAP